MALIDSEFISLGKFPGDVSSDPYSKGWNDAIDAILENAPEVRKDNVNIFDVMKQPKAAGNVCPCCGAELKGSEK